MAFSIEARVPLLDHRLVEYGLALPDHLKVRRGWSKFALRQAVQGLMPESVRLRKSKLSFSAPDRVWLLQYLRPLVIELINGDLRCQKYVNPGALRHWSNTESYLGMFRIIVII
jgi:asparagine synthase (glutamine-hydrolysing)